LGNFGRVDNWPTFVQYITSGFADPTGRPLALLSFLLDANDWPADPEPFKRTNVLLHLLNGILLAWLLLLLGRRLRRPAGQASMAAVVAAGLWLLHPLWISTTLYVVQREAMLAATFVLLGLLGYVHGRSLLEISPFRATAWIVGWVGTCTALGFLCKANGLLLPMLILVVEYGFLGSVDEIRHPARLRACLAVVAFAPASLLAAYLLFEGYIGITQGVPVYRPWTFAQRLMSEPRALCDYLTLLFVPRPYSRGLFNDDFPVSTGILHPWTTLPSMALLAVLATLAVRGRRPHPALALSLLFYFTGHLMESTTIPLELYFEHRNYMPALLLFWPLALWLSDGQAWRRLKGAIAAGALLLLSAETYAAASLWGEPGIQALVWAAQNPDSPRAQAYAANAERAMDLDVHAEARLRKALAAHPDEIQLAINLLGVRCHLGSISESDVVAAERALRTGSNRGPLSFDWMSEAVNLVSQQACVGLDAATLQRLIDASRENAQAAAPKFQQDLLDLEGQLALAGGDHARAETKFLEALKVAPHADVALKQAAILGAHGLPAAGLAQLDYYRRLVPTEAPPNVRNMESLHQWILYRDGYWDREIERLRKTLLDDAAASQTPTSGNLAQ
jgi:protein O-mannosyl-transferase